MEFNMENYKLRLNYRNKSIKEVYYSTKSGKGDATFKDIELQIKKVQAVAKKHNQQVEFEVALKYDKKLTGLGWRSGYMFGVNDKPSIFDAGNTEGFDMSGYMVEGAEVQSHFKEFVLYVIPMTVTKGGSDKYNDCLYDCIKLVIKDINLLPKTVQKASGFKRMLKLNRGDKIDIKLFPKIEDLLRINLNCSGNAVYTSACKYDRKINLKLVAEHFTLDKSTRKYKVRHNSRRVAFCEINERKTYNFISYKRDKIRIKEWTHADRVNDNFFVIYKPKDKKTLRQKFEEFLKAREEILKHTDNFIDLFSTPLFSQCAQRVLYVFGGSNIQPEPITALEAEWVNNSFKGALIYAQEGTYEQAISIDQNSMYSHYLSSDKFMIPYKSGEFKKLDKITNSVYPYGIYRAIVTSTNVSLNKFFRFNKLNYYTHFDLSNATSLGFTVELIQDDQANCLLYDSKSRTYGHRAYSQTITYLFNLKNKCKYAKGILSALWGSMTEKNTKKISILKTQEEYEDIQDNCMITKITKTDTGTKVHYINSDKIFKTDYARVGPFLTAYCRLQMQKFINTNFKLEDVIRIHTDSVTLNNSSSIDTALISCDIGKFKIEHNGKCTIKNALNCVWTESK